MLQTTAPFHGTPTPAPAAPPAPNLSGQSDVTVVVPERPALAPQVQLCGELHESGFTEPQWLIQRDGRFIQVSELLYRLAEQINGARTLAEIAAGVTETTDWLVTAEQVRQLLQRRLIPLGLIDTVAGASPPALPAPPRSPLALNLRRTLIGPRAIAPLTRVLQVLYAPPILLPLLLAIAGAHAWLYLRQGQAVAAGVHAALYTPGFLLVVLALLLFSAIIHECGHAAALRYGGGACRAIGVGFYLIYPAFFSDVTDSYRLRRGARLRTDLGGVYFHLIFALGLLAFAQMSGLSFLLFLVLLIDLAVLYEFIPFVRLDGYWALADLVGLPDFFALMGPFVASLIPGRPGRQGRALPPLKRWVKAVFLLYMMATVPLLALGYVLMIKVLPTFLGTTWTALRWQFAVLGNLLSTRDALLLILVIVQMLLLALPAVGALYMFTLSSRRLLRALWRWSKPTLLRRLGGGLVGAAAFAVVTILWAPQLPWGAWWTTPARAVPGETARTAPRPGAAIGGVQCGSMEMLQHHTHTALTLYLNGHPVLLPANIGIPVNPAINRNGQPTCLYWLHTHDFDHALGIVHVESPLKHTYTLGQFLDIWQDTAQWDAQGGLGASVDATFVTALRQASSDAIHAYVNGRPWPGSYRAIPLHAHALITLEIGRPLEPPTTRFTFPAGE